MVPFFFQAVELILVSFIPVDSLCLSSHYMVPGRRLIVFSGKEGVSVSTNEGLGAHESCSFSLLGGHEPVILCVFLSDKKGTCSKTVERATKSEP